MVQSIDSRDVGRDQNMVGDGSPKNIENLPGMLVAKSAWWRVGTSIFLSALYAEPSVKQDAFFFFSAGWRWMSLAKKTVAGP